jgi:DMSO/TMAO reductase YedYZ molybdopterin-dependent catalytic subunit
VKFRSLRNRRIPFAPLLVAVIFVCAAVSAAQTAESQPDASARIGGEVGHPYSITAADLAAMPHQSVSVSGEKNGREVYQGVPVVDLLRRAGAPLGNALRGPKMRLYVLVKARDNYAVVFGLTEFDPAFTDRVILLAYSRAGEALGPVEGPLRLIVPGDKRHARWVRQVTEIEVKPAK